MHCKDFVLQKMEHQVLTNITCAADTGVGKTLAYGIPLVKYLQTKEHIREVPSVREIAKPLVLTKLTLTIRMRTPRSGTLLSSRDL